MCTFSFWDTSCLFLHLWQNCSNSAGQLSQIVAAVVNCHSAVTNCCSAVANCCSAVTQKCHTFLIGRNLTHRNTCKKVLARLDISQKSEMTQRHCVCSNRNEIFFFQNVFFDEQGKNWRNPGQTNKFQRKQFVLTRVWRDWRSCLDMLKRLNKKISMVQCPKHVDSACKRHGWHFYRVSLFVTC